LFTRWSCRGNESFDRVAQPGSMRRIEAAGGVLWRPAGGRLGVETALVHRPGADDWSLPKGRLLPGEHVLLGAVREVAEETGQDCVVGPHLGRVGYLKKGVPKRVDYWSLRAGRGGFEPTREIDDLVWLPPDAAARLARERDRPILDAFLRLRPDQEWSSLLLVRNGKAVPAQRWDGRDEERPLDEHGHTQAGMLAEFLAAYGVRRALAVDLRRCRETLQPLAGRNVPVECAALGRHSDDDHVSARLLAEIADARVPTALCAPRRILARLWGAFGLGTRRSRRPDVPNAGLCVLHMRDTPRRRVAGPELIATRA
jgi:8-oxo-dGTP diphosphatase